MFNSKKNYVSPEVNVISVDKDIITVSGGGDVTEEDDNLFDDLDNSSGGTSTTPVPLTSGNWSR